MIYTWQRHRKQERWAPTTSHNHDEVALWIDFQKKNHFFFQLNFQKCCFLWNISLKIWPFSIDFNTQLNEASWVEKRWDKRKKYQVVNVNIAS